MRCNVLCLASCLVSLLVTAVASAKTDDPDAVRSAICGERSPCVVTEMKGAGRSHAGELLVVKVALYDAPASDQRTLDGKCLPYEYWLVIRKKSGKISARPLLCICNDGYGSRMLGDDQVAISENRFTHTRVGGSAWMWATTRIVQLDPVSIIAETENDWWTLGSATMKESWRFADWTGFATSSRRACTGHDAIERAYQPIPRMALDDEFRATEWRTTALDGCATRVDSRGGASEKTPGGGFVIYGKPGDPTDAAMRVLLSSENELFVEVEDDIFVPTATTWINADHLELWLGRPNSHELQCMDTSGPLFQWGIDLNATIYPAFGKPSPDLVVERAEQTNASGKKVMRFKIQLPKSFASSSNDQWMITVAYSDSDDGKGQKRIIATSRLKLGSLPTLGDVRDVQPQIGVCRREAGELHPMDTRVFDEGVPVLQ